MQRVYRLLKEAREQGDIPWEWIVDETRALERTSTWDDPAEYARCVARSYRRDFWNQQPVRVEVWSEKGTVRGVLAPVLDHYAVGFRVPARVQQRHRRSMTLPRMTMGDSDRALRRRLRSERHVHVGGGFARTALQVRRRSRRLERIALTRNMWTVCRRSRQPISAKTRATNGSAPTTGIVAGNSMRWTPTISATALRRQSWS